MSDEPSRSTYRRLDPNHLADAIALLHRRIEERFPDRSLGKIAAELETLSLQAVARSKEIRRPHMSLRLVGVLAAACLGLSLLGGATQTPMGGVFDNLGTFLQMLDTISSLVVVLGATFFFLVTLESRFKRKRTLEAIHELRALVHVVDIHQLTKDPHRLSDSHRTASSPNIGMTLVEMLRYLDYCTEMMSLASKLGVIYAQDLQDPEVHAEVHQFEHTCTGLSQKIWQKIMLLHSPQIQAAPLPAQPSEA